MGNRVSVRVDQGDVGPVTHENDRSWLYGYDKLNRLIDAELGRLAADNLSIDLAPPGGLPREMNWHLDSLGNWSAGANQQSMIERGDFDGDPQTPPTERTLHHDVIADNEQGNGNNELSAVVENGTATAYIHDAVGNLVYDGRYVYLYDGLQRLVQVSNPGSVTFTPEGKIDTGTLGSRIARFAYDGFGRLIRIDRTVAGTGGGGPGTTFATVHVDLYYDGVRRIMEVGSSTGEPGAAGPDTPWDDPHVANEYVYGPGDVDEFIFQSMDAVAEYILQDDNYNVVGIADEAGAILEQYGYSPYGKTLTVERMGANPYNRIGHQGLFFERFDADPYVGGSNGNPPPADSITPGAIGLYYNRNRWYSANLGRFTQRDPNASGLPILMAAAMNGEGLEAAAGGFDAATAYGDGMNLYQYVHSNPITGRDPMGTDDFDDAMNDLQGYKVGAIGFINEAMGVILIGTKNAINFAGGLLGADLFEAGKNIINGEGSFWDWLEVGLTLTGPIAKVGMKAFSWGRKLAQASKTSRNSAIYNRTCHITCFVAGTLVATPAGEVPIEQLEVGDAVLTRDEHCLDDTIKVGLVSGVFRSLQPSTLWIEFSNGVVLGATPPHEFFTADRGWVAAQDLLIGDQVGEGLNLASGGHLGDETATVVGLHLDPTPMVVYNLEIEGGHTYYAEGVWVHNCPAILSHARKHGGSLHDGVINYFIQMVQKVPGVSGIRKNQALVANGKKISNLRPDIQYIKDGKVHIIEVIHTSKRVHGKDTFMQILGSKFGSYADEFVD